MARQNFAPMSGRAPRAAAGARASSPQARCSRKPVSPSPTSTARSSRPPRPLTGPNSQFEGCIDIGDVVTEANKRGIFSVGIGDHGNELGFGTIYDAVVKTMPKGKALATVVKTDVVVPAMMSNWGCYGIEGCLAFLLRKPELIHTPEMEKRIVQACLDAGGLEAMYCTTDFFVDGLDGETSMAFMQILSNIVRKNLEPPGTGLTH